jgi:hypothetical protein
VWLDPTTSPSMEPRNEFTSEPEDPRSPSIGELIPKPSVEPDDGVSSSAVCTPDSILGIELFRAPSSTLRVEETFLRFATFFRFKDFRNHVINCFFTIGEKNH